MARILILALALAAMPAAAQSFLEKFIDKQIESATEEHKKESIEAVTQARDPADRIKAVEWLAVQREPQLVAVAAKALADPDAKVREATARALWRIEKHAEPARPQLVAALEDADPNVVAQAAGALQALGMKESELAGPRKRVFAAADASVASRFLVSRNLVGHEPNAKLVEPMIAFLEANVANRHNAELATKALERLVKNTKDRALIAPLKDALAATRTSQAAYLQTLALFDPKPEGWNALLTAQLQSPQPRMRSEALYLLGRAGPSAAGEVEKVVAVATSDPDKSIRRVALRTLAEMAEVREPAMYPAAARVSAAARPALTKAMADEDGDVRGEAKSALAKLDEAPKQAEWLYARALSQEDAASVKVFLEAGMRPRIDFSADACRPNQRPTKSETKAILRMMIERGVDPNASDEHGNTALMHAASRGCDREVIRMLIKAGAKVDAKNSAGLTPFEHGLWMGHDGLEEIIAAGYRLPPEKVKAYLEGYKDRPAAQAMVRKAVKK